MKIISYTDDNGLIRKSMLRDNDPDSAASRGIPMDPPNIMELDWDGIKRDLHNELTNLGLLTWDDVMKSPNQMGLRSAILACLEKRLVRLYRQEEKK